MNLTFYKSFEIRKYLVDVYGPLICFKDGYYRFRSHGLGLEMSNINSNKNVHISLLLVQINIAWH